MLLAWAVHVFFLILWLEVNNILYLSSVSALRPAVVVAFNIDDVEKKQMSMLRLKAAGDTYLMNKVIRQNFAFATKNTLISWLFQR